jgi:hypothetical protein
MSSSESKLKSKNIFGFANIISKKWKNRPANGWLWLEAPTFLIYLVIIFGHIQGWALKF